MLVIKILNKINQFLADTLIFTAYDVTKALRADGVIVNHSEVKNVLQNYDINSLGYETTTSTWCDSKGVSPLVYGPKNLSCEIKKLFDGSLAKSQTPVSYAFLESIVKNSIVEDIIEDEVVESANTVSVLTDESIILTIDSRQRCCIPNRIVNTAFSAGDRVNVWYDENADTTYVVSYDDEDDLYDTILTVDKSGNIRIPVSYLPEAVSQQHLVKISYDDTGFTIV